MTKVVIDTSYYFIDTDQEINIIFEKYRAAEEGGFDFENSF